MLVAVSTLVDQFPFDLASRLPCGGCSWPEILVLTTGGLGPLWLPLLLVAQRTWGDRHLRARLASTRPFEPDADPQLREAIRQAFAVVPGSRVDLRIRGDPAAVIDDGLPLVVSPTAALHRVGLGREQASVVIPAAFWVRFRAHPRAFGFVLAHELAHIANGDLRLLFGARDLLLAASLVGGLAVLSRYTYSIVADVRSGAGWQAAWAALVGTNYALVTFALAGTSVFLVRLLIPWREALADATAERLFGTAAREETERLLAGNGPSPEASDDVRRSRPAAAAVAGALVGQPWQVAAVAFLATAGVEKLAGLLAYLRNFRIDSPPWQEVAHLLATTIQDLALFGVLFLVLRTLVLANPSGTRLRALLVNLGLLVGGTAAAHLLLQTVPMVVTSTSMPEGFDQVHRHAPLPLITASTASSLLEAIAWGFWALLAVLLWRRGERFLALLPAFLLGPVQGLEVKLAPSLAGGLLAPISAWAVGFWGVVRLLPDRSSARAFVGPLALGAAGWAANAIGLGDVTPWAEASHRNAMLAYEARDLDAARAALAQAARRDPLRPTAPADLARVEAQRGDLDAAIGWADRALAAPYLHDWAQTFELLSLAAELRLTRRRDADLPAARRLYDRAVDLHRRNSRLPRSKVASTLYNAAAERSLAGDDRLAALLLLAEAAAIDGRLARAALDDPDLAALGLSRPQHLSEGARWRLAALPDHTPEGLARAAADGRARPDELAGFLVLVVRAEAEAAAANGQDDR